MGNARGGGGFGGSCCAASGGHDNLVLLFSCHCSTQSFALKQAHKRLRALRRRRRLQRACARDTRERIETLHYTLSVLNKTTRLVSSSMVNFLTKRKFTVCWRVMPLHHNNKVASRLIKRRWRASGRLRKAAPPIIGSCCSCCRSRHSAAPRLNRASLQSARSH